MRDVTGNTRDVTIRVCAENGSASGLSFFALLPPLVAGHYPVPLIIELDISVAASRTMLCLLFSNTMATDVEIK